MTPEQFAYWMQGFVELTNGAPPTDAQWAVMVEHLKTVFVKVTPPVLPVPSVMPISGDGRIPGQFPFGDWPNRTVTIC